MPPKQSPWPGPVTNSTRILVFWWWMSCGGKGGLGNARTGTVGNQKYRKTREPSMWMRAPGNRYWLAATRRPAATVGRKPLRWRGPKILWGPSGVAHALPRKAPHSYVAGARANTAVVSARARRFRDFACLCVVVSRASVLLLRLNHFPFRPVSRQPFSFRPVSRLRFRTRRPTTPYRGCYAKRRVDTRAVRSSPRLTSADGRRICALSAEFREFEITIVISIIRFRRN